MMLFGNLFKHGPSLGGKEEGVKYNDMYDQTLIYYKALFGTDAPPQFWEPTNIRFSPELFSCSYVNL
jgi:hypothetical protein